MPNKSCFKCKWGRIWINRKFISISITNFGTLYYRCVCWVVHWISAFFLLSTLYGCYEVDQNVSIANQVNKMVLKPFLHKPLSLKYFSIISMTQPIQVNYIILFINRWQIIMDIWKVTFFRKWDEFVTINESTPIKIDMENSHHKLEVELLVNL